MRKPVASLVLWSVISAAFIGPGTVTTAVSAGSSFGLELLWAVTLATGSCILLQEVSARICIASGLTLGEALEVKFGKGMGRRLQLLIGTVVILGCAAYEAGNILGGVSGLKLITGIGAQTLTILLTVAALLVLLSGGKKIIGNLMGWLVLMMGMAFFVLAVQQPVALTDVAKGAWVPSMPGSSDLLVLGLMGTTIVPYNVFIGGAISRGQEISTMRLGLVFSVLAGGAITAAILVAGTGVTGFNSFEGLYVEFDRQLGGYGATALAVGLFAAGFSSAITSPYASRLIAETVFGLKDPVKVRWIWLAVLATGFVFGISGVKPIPVILIVQALNGLILPLIAYFLVVVVNEERIIPQAFRPGPLYNLLLLGVLGSVALISLNNIDKSVSMWMGTTQHVEVVAGLSALAVLFTALQLFRKGNTNQQR